MRTGRARPGQRSLGGRVDLNGARKHGARESGSRDRGKLEQGLASIGTVGDAYTATRGSPPNGEKSAALVVYSGGAQLPS